MQAGTQRAKPLSVDERRAAIIDAVIPLIMERGREVTSRQIAEAAGVAEGTIFRAFGDKDSVIEAAVFAFLDPAPLVAAIRSIDPALTLEQKLADILFHLRSRMTGIVGIMQAVGMTGRPPIREDREQYYALIAEVLRPDLDALQFEPHRVAQLVRLVSFASSIPHFNQGQEIPTEDLARFLTYGVAGVPADGRSSNAS